MTATTHSTGDEPREDSGDATDLTAPEITPDQDVGGVLVGAASNLCSNCAAPLATDQKYCVECGTRRGIPRFRVAGADDHKADASLHAAPVPAPASISSRLLALLAVIVVLAAIALGFVIGNSSSTTTVRLTGVSGVAKTAGSSTSGSGTKSSSTGSSKSSSASSSGSSCTKGSPGCKNGKQTGNFFGS